MKSTVPHRSRKSSIIGWCVAQIVRMLGLTLRLKVVDPQGILRQRGGAPVIWILWHNRILGMPVFYRRRLRHRKICVLTSASRDGAVLERVMGCFGFLSVRGSSSKRGAIALAELCTTLKSGNDVGITPDGPRGPCYRLAAGPVKLAQLSGAPIVPLRVQYATAWRLKSWDRLFIPKPFSSVQIVLGEPAAVDPSAVDSAFEAERQRIEDLLRPDAADL
ncbi:MAG: lysophospholipid acyltransferase family protein [Verrucomicrobiales bacterium]|nr:lysophospholipid acyltransferase family protein [Verrucomicrobiales bacterium]